MVEIAERSQGDRAIRVRLAYGWVVVAIIMAGLTIRYPGLGVPWTLAKYAGSVLWGTMVFFILAIVAADMTAHRRAGIAAFIATVVELSRLYHAPWLDDFRLTTAGALLLGRIFSGWNILAYWTGIAGGMVADKLCRRRRGEIINEAQLSLDGRGRPPLCGGRVRVMPMADEIFPAAPSPSSQTLLPSREKGFRPLLAQSGGQASR